MAKTDSGSQSMDSLLKRLEGWLAKHRRRYLKGLRPKASPADLDALQAGLGLPLPAELRQLLAWHNGQRDDFVGSFEESWNLMSTQQILDAYRELDAMGGDAPVPWKQGWIPFLDDDAGNFLCLDTSQSGVPVREMWLGKQEAPIAAASLSAWLEHFVTGLEQGKYQEDSERGTLMRKK